MKYIFLLLFISLTVLGQENQIIDVQEFKIKITDPTAVVLDVRTQQEFYSGHIENASNKNVYDKDFEHYCAKLAKEKRYYVYCFTGMRSHQAAEIMRKEGLTTFELKGGIKAWKEATLPLVK